MTETSICKSFDVFLNFENVVESGRKNAVFARWNMIEQILHC